MDKLPFINEEEVQHHLAESVADDFVRDYESNVKSLIKLRKIYSGISLTCSVLIILVSLVSGILGVLSLNPIIGQVAAIATLCIGVIERSKIYSEQKHNNTTRRLVKMFEKSGLKTYGVYDNDSEGTDGASNASNRKKIQVSTA